MASLHVHSVPAAKKNDTTTRLSEDQWETVVCQRVKLQ